MMNDQQQTENFVSFDPAMPIAPYGKNSAISQINPDEPHWHWTSGIGAWIVSVLLLLILSVVATVIYLVAVNISGGTIDLKNAEMNSNYILAVLISVFPAHLLTIALGWAIVTKNGELPFWKSIGWEWRGYNIFICLLIAIAMYGIGIGIILLMGKQENDLDRVLLSSRWAVYLTAFMATFTAPFVEELIYRGIMFPAIKYRFGTAAAVITVTVLFAAVHVLQYVESEKLTYLSNYSTITVILVLSLVLTLIRAKSQSILPCFMIHTFFNGIQAILLVIAPYLTPTSEAPIVDPKPAVIWFLSVF